MSINTVTISGRVANDITLGKTKNNKSYVRFSLAVDKRGKDAGASFINCVAWDGRAETIAQYVKKGDKFLVSGRLDQSSYEKGGVKQSFISVIVDDFEFMGGKKENSTPSEEVGLFDKKPQTEEFNYDSVPF